MDQVAATGPFSLESALTAAEMDAMHDLIFKGTANTEDLVSDSPVVVIGNSSVGKTNLLSRWMDDKFEATNATISVEFSQKGFRVDGKMVKVQLWDTAGQEKFRAMTQAYYRNAAGCILVYDITDLESFRNLESWLDAVREAPGNEDLQIMVCGNKADLQGDRAVTTDQGLKWAKDHGLSFLETSAKNGNNVHQAFQIVLQDIYKKQTQEKRLEGAAPGQGRPTGPIWTSTVLVDSKNANQAETGACGCN